MAPLIRHYLTLDDLLAIRERMIGIGSVGGKALGMLLARAILRQDAPALHAQLEAHDLLVGTEALDTFLVRNGLWWIRRQQRDPAAFLANQIDEAHERIMRGSFMSTLHQFEGMLDYFGECLLFIVRSSSRLEDQYGNAFAGQYDSVFCANRGPREKRLEDLLNAVRLVYASTLAEKALRYRQRRAARYARADGAADHACFGNRRAPPISTRTPPGSDCRSTPIAWNPRIDMQAGVVRLVAGLGTRC